MQPLWLCRSDPPVYPVGQIVPSLTHAIAALRALSCRRGRDTGSVAMTADEFVQSLRARVPDATVIIEEHLEDNEGELLVHLLVADLLRFCIHAFDAGEVDLSGRCLDAVASALTAGDEHLRNAVEVSFVEHAWDAPPGFLASWPEPLQVEWREQHTTS